MKVIVYCRKSTESEERQVQSLEAQQNWCDEYVLQQGFEVVEKIIESKSAKHPGREGFNKMMTLLSQGKAEGIVCWQLNRLSRNPIDEGSIKWLTQQGIIKEIHSTDGISNGQNILLMSVHFGMATQYIIDLRKNVLRGMVQKFEKGGAIGQAPIGYWNNKNTNEYEVDPEESEFVKQIFMLRAKKVSYKEIGERLFKQGFKTKGGNPKPKGTIEQIIRNDFYVGILSFQGKKTMGKHDTFISKKLFDEANGFRKTPKGDINHSEFIFKGLLAYGGKKMRAYKKKGNIYYREAEGVKPNLNISQRDLLEKIEEILPSYNLPGNLKKDFSKGLLDYFEKMNKGNKRSIMEAQKKINELHEENKEVVRRNIKGKIVDEIAEEMQEENLMKIKDLEERLKDLNHVHQLIDSEVVELWKLATENEKLWEKSDLSGKGRVLDLLFVELSLSDKKELTLEENKLFENIRNVNFSIWHPH